MRSGTLYAGEVKIKGCRFMSDEIRSIDNFTIKNEIITCHNFPIVPIDYSKRFIDYEKIKRISSFDGEMSYSSQLKLSDRLFTWLKSIEIYNKYQKGKYERKDHKPVFFTLTISDDQELTDYSVKQQMLKKMIMQLKYNGLLHYYIWKAEPQKRGNIHFHVVGDRYIDKFDLQSRWNKIQKDHGTSKKYYEKFGTWQPPSTHIRQFDNEVDGHKYMMKYVQKKCDARAISGQLWNSDREMSKLKPVQINDSIINCEEFVQSIRLNFKEIFRDDYYSVIKPKEGKIENWLPKNVNDYLINYYTANYESLYKS